MIDDKTKQAIFSKLETAEEFYIPIKKLWKELRKEAFELPGLYEFEEELRKEEIFEFITPSKHDEDEEFEEEMEALGFYSGPRVKLKARVITKEDFMRILLKHTQNVTDNLVKAYQVKPSDIADEVEDALIDGMVKSQKIKENISKIMEDK